jgi:anaerobic ribonucleoside-triphosphate reductase
MSEYCGKCGNELVDVCPICGKPVEVYSRPCGYLRPVSTWNDGKQREFADRKTFQINEGDHVS